MTKIWVFLGFVWVSQISIADPIGLKLIFSTAIWRHGDRAPLGTYPTDPIQENWWNTGGGGWGELTPTGMAQHFQLGTIIRNRYINGTFNFLPPYYDAKKIYVRATDHNRTIISAMANMVAMYTNPAVEKAGIEYPDIAGWPAGFVPIAAHSQDYDTDCVANIGCTCPRREALQAMAHTLPEYVNYVNSPNVSQLLSNLSVYVGLPVNLGMFWVIPDTLLSERVHFMDVLLKNVSWYSEDFYQRMQVINHHMNYFDSGIYQKPSIVNGIDVSFEILKLRVGPVMKEVYERMLAKVNCLKDPKNCDPYYQNLLYYVYSAHDETIYSMFTAFGIEDLCAPGAGEWPAFAAATLVELFLDRNNDPYFQILYRANSTTDFQAMTPLIAACGGATYCPLNVFKEAAEFYKTDMEIHAYCQVLPSQSSSTISVLIATFFSFVVFLRLL